MKKEKRDKTPSVCPIRQVVFALICFVGLVHFFALQESNAQDTTIISGTILNADNLKPLPYTHLVKNDTVGYITDQEGHFTIRIHLGDTLTISYLGFKTREWLAPRKPSANRQNYIIKLSPQPYSIEAVTVRPYGTYREFKHAFMQMKQRPPEKETAIQNMSYLRAPHRKPKQANTSVFDRNIHIHGPEQITLFSTKSDQGIIGLINELLQNE